MSPTPEFSLPGFDIGDYLGGNGATSVFRAVRQQDGLAVVLKTLQGSAQNLKNLARLRHEFEIIETLDHPELIKAYELRHHQDRTALILEDVGGVSLYHKLRLRPCKIGDCLDLIIGVTRQLALLHERGIIHKDVNPSNIVRTDRGLTRLIDFSIASRFTRESQRATAAGLLEGTLAYISPEQTGRMNRAIDYRTDFYSLGVTCYQLLTGRLPFAITDPLELVHCHIAHVPTPAHHVHPAIPVTLSHIVERLMAKNAEDRYQSAFGLLVDLERCRDGLHKHGGVIPFKLGERDQRHVFQIPQRLYGRKDDLANLETALERASRGARALLLVSGPSGAGKSALIQEIYKPMAKYRGYLIAGKFDQFQRNLPYASLVQACRELIRQLLSESSERLAFWRERILHQLGGSIGVIMAMLPELGYVLGPVQLPAVLPTAETENRFHLAVQKFLALFAARERPLVMVFDDLQWADLPSLKLMRALLTDPELQALLVVGSYRSEEVDDTHPLREFQRSLSLDQIPVQQIQLRMLSRDHVTAIVAQTLQCERERERAVPLATAIYARTAGNPFFTCALLQSLHEQGLIAFDHIRGQWHWDMLRIERLNPTEDALDLLGERLRRLAPETQRALQVASCLGGTFDAGLLAHVLAIEPEVLMRHLELALCEDLIIALNPGTSEAWVEPSERPLLFEFLHDQVQQAAYAMAEPVERAARHLQIGRTLWRRGGSEPSGDLLFTVVTQMNLGRLELDDDEERARLVALNTRAGHKARISGAFAPALEFLEAGLAHLGEKPWRQHGLTRALVMELAICRYFSGQVKAAEALFEDAHEHAANDLERAEVFRTRTMLYAHSGKYVEAMEIGMRGLALLGHPVPDRDDVLRGAIADSLMAIREYQRAHSMEDLLALPRLENAHVKAVLHQLIDLWSPAACVNLNLLKYLVLEIVKLSLSHGNLDISSYGYVGYALVLGSGFGDYRTGEAFGELGIRLNQQFDNHELKCRVYFVHGALVKPWRAHIRASVPLLSEAYQAGLVSGDILWASLCLLHRVIHRVFAGDHLKSVEIEAETCLAFLRKGGYEQSVEILHVVVRLLQWLRDPLAGQQAFDETAFLTRNQRRFYLVAVNHLYACKAQQAYLFGQYQQALQAAERAEKFDLFKFGWPSLVDQVLYRGLASAALWAECGACETEHHIAAIHDCLEKLQKWASECPDNFQCRYLLLAAETARVTQNFEKALDYFDEAIASARQYEFTQIEALANERAGRYLLARNKPRLARVYLNDACFLYGRWDAVAKEQLLRDEFPELLTEFAGAADAYIHSTTTTQENSGALDMTTFLKASLAISSEIQLDRLLAKLMAIALESAGAQSGYLMLREHGGLFLEAAGSVHGEEVAVLQARPLAECDMLAQSVVHFVYNTREVVVLSHAAKEGQFTADPHITAQKVRSLLCQPIYFKGRLAGILYLENNLVAGAFTPRRLEMLQMLVSEAAIAIENARLYTDLAAAHERLHHSNEEMARVNQSLERKVAERTSELSQRNIELAAMLSRLQEMQQHIIQQEKMASLGTLSAGIAHEIRNPLNFVNNFADLSRELVAELKDLTSTGDVGELLALLGDLDGNLAKIHHHGKRADEIVQSMLLQSHSKVPIKPTATDVNATLADAVALAAENLGEKLAEPLHIVKEFDGQLGPIEGVPQDLGRVFLNLVDNAIDSMAARIALGEPDYRPQLQVTTRDAGREVEIHLRDNGRGISAEIKDQIFNPFFTTKPAGQGTGLGLSISYDIVVKQHQGQISVNSEPGAFTNFTIRLPKQLYKPQPQT